MNNMELTRAVEVLTQQLTAVNAQVTDLSNRLHVAVPDVNTNIQTSADALTNMYNAIRSDIQLVIDQFNPLVNTVNAINAEATQQYAKLQQLGKNVNIRFNERKQMTSDKTSALEAAFQCLSDQMGQRAGTDT